MTASRRDEMEVFACVADRGSFASAARVAELSPSAVSKLVARLEARLRVRLVSRTTHGLALTDEGERYADACRSALDTMLAAEAELDGAAPMLRGTVRVASSGPLAFHVVAPALEGFRDRHPGIDVHLLISDSLIDLVEERVDVALRIGVLKDSTLKLRRLGTTRRVHVAAPCYVDAHGLEALCEDPVAHHALRYTRQRRTPAARGKDVSETVTDSGEMLRHLALQGLGVAWLARFHVARDLADGRLVELPVAGAETVHDDVSALVPAHRQPAPRVSAFLDHLVASASGLLSG